jgi:tetratricopeptide (TPR) repeat protein
MKFVKKLTLVFLLAISLLPMAASATGVIDKVEVTENKAKSEVDITLYFLTNVRYIRHFPLNESDNIHIELEFQDGPGGKRDFINSPPTKLVPSFEVNYPDRATNSIGFQFSKKIKYRVTPDSTGRGIVIHVEVDKPKDDEVVVEPIEPVQVEPIVVPAVPEDKSVDQHTTQLMAEAKAAMQAKDFAKAIEIINGVLNLPPHANSQEAQELIGVAREKNGEYKRAKAEYNLYLKLYPTGEGAERVKTRLAEVEALVVKQASSRRPTVGEREDVHETTVYGSWNQYYYDAHSKNYNPSPIPDDKTHDQSSLVSQLDITGKLRHNEYDGKLVFRHIDTMDFLPGDRHEDKNRTLSAYAELQDNDLDYMVRLGRQSGNSGGVLGRFDGAWFRYGLTDSFKVNLVGGSLSEYDVDYKRHFVGVNFDIMPAGGKFSSNVYFINQRVDGLTDRRAVGTELRYFDQGKSVYSLLDYDTVFNQLNIALVQANWQTESGINFNALYDHRKSPLLQAINSLPVYFQFGTTTLGQVLRQNIATKDQIYDDAKALTLDTDLFLFGATKQVTKRWQVGGDIRMNRSSGTDAAGTAAVAKAIKDAIDAGTLTENIVFTSQLPQPGTGNIWTYTAQLVGTDTIFSNDTSVINFSYSESDLNKIYSSVLSNVVSPTPKWRVDSSLKLIKVNTEPSTTSTAIAPTLRVGYKLTKAVTLECEIGLEWDTIDDDTGHTRIFRDFSFIGYRWDF